MLVKHMKPVGSWCRIFQRYDFDSSGTVNSRDELEQLTINLAYALKLQVKTPTLAIVQLVGIPPFGCRRVRRLCRMPLTHAHST